MSVITEKAKESFEKQKKSNCQLHEDYEFGFVKGYYKRIADIYVEEKKEKENLYGVLLIAVCFGAILGIMLGLNMH